MSEARSIEKLRREHVLDAFDCGQPDLNAWLIKHALQTKVQVPRKPMWAWSTTQWWVITAWLRARWNMLMLRNASVKDWRGYPVPIMLLARLAVHKDWQGKGIGRALPRDAVLRTTQAADIAGIRALAVHAKDDKARQYFEQFDFIPSPTDPLHLFVLLKDLRKIVGT